MEEMEALLRAVTNRLFVELEASGRHVHVTAEQAMKPRPSSRQPTR